MQDCDDNGLSPFEVFGYSTSVGCIWKQDNGRFRFFILFRIVVLLALSIVPLFEVCAALTFVSSPTSSASSSVVMLVVVVAATIGIGSLVSWCMREPALSFLYVNVWNGERTVRMGFTVISMFDSNFFAVFDMSFIRGMVGWYGGSSVDLSGSCCCCCCCGGGGGESLSVEHFNCVRSFLFVR